VIRDCALSVELLSDEVIHHEFVIIAGGNDLVLSVDDLETPDFALEMRLHEGVLSGAIRCHGVFEFQNGSIAESYEQVSIEQVDGARER